MTQNENIMKSLHALAKQEQSLQAQEAEMIEIKNLLSRALHTITAHEHKLNILCGTNIVLAREVQAMRDQQDSFGVN
jgi:hypothetical protein